MGQKDFEAYFSQFPVRSYKKQWSLIHSGDIVQKIFYIKGGYVRLYAVSAEGQEMTLIIYKPGEFFPLIAALNPHTSFRYYIETLTYASIISVPVSSFIAFFEGKPDLLLGLLETTMMRLDRIIRRLEYAVFGDAYQKVASILIILEEAFGRKVGKEAIIEAPLTHREIATIVGLSRETTSAILSSLAKEGYIAYKGKHVVIKNRKGLLKQSLFES